MTHPLLLSLCLIPGLSYPLTQRLRFSFCNPPGNHTGYRQWTGTRATAQEITDLYAGLKQSYLDDFDMMLSGYIPGAEGVTAVGNIAKGLKEKFRDVPGKFFWVLDPVMGDNGKLYVAPEVVPAYKALLPYADLILPNQFEAE